MDNLRVGRAKIAGNIPTVFSDPAVNVDSFEIACLLIGRDKVFRNVLANVWIRQGARSEFLGVVSRKLFAGKVT